MMMTVCGGPEPLAVLQRGDPMSVGSGRERGERGSEAEGGEGEVDWSPMDCDGVMISVIAGAVQAKEGW